MNRATALASILGAAVTLNARRVEAAPSLGSLSLATDWLGAHPTIASLHGRVVLVDIFTFECINCTNITPGLKRLYAAHRRTDFEIVAVHTPEVPSYQKSISYLTSQTRKAALPWPIAVDNEHRIWDAYNISAWPTQLIFDRSGRLSSTIIGDSQDREVAAAVQSLLRAG